MSRPLPFFVACAASLPLFLGTSAMADPPTPSGGHPRLFMTSAELAAYKTNAAKKGTAAAGLVAQCEDTIKNAKDYTTRGGSDGNNWPQSAVACAFAYVATGTSTYLTQALLYWQASLNDDQTIGDGLGCVAGVNTDWQGASWSNGAPPVILTVTHDTGYPMRWYAPDIAVTYDWLYTAPGVTAALQTQTQVCLTAWNDYYTASGYHNTEAGANYNAGYVAGKALSAIAIGTDGNADGHLWTQSIDDVFGTLLVGTGLAGADGGVGSQFGVMVGGDWGEGWEYGPLSVIEYSAATAALEAAGASIASQMNDWNGDLFLRAVYSRLPSNKFEFCGDGDCDITTPNLTPDINALDAVLLGPASDQSASWALSLKQGMQAGIYVYNAIAETRAVTAQDYTAQTPAPPLWYLARGTRELFARTAWNDPNAFYGVFTSAPNLNSDHQHFDASSFVFSHGSDDLIVDSAPYGVDSSWDSNAVTADSSVVKGDYAPSQTPWSKAELLWARGTGDATYAARSDFAHAFDFDGTKSDIPYAHREWTMLPEGEVVVIDRVHTSAATRNMYVTFHTNTGGGGLKATNGIYLGTVGSSQVAIHPVLLSGGTPTVLQPSANCSAGNSCSYPCAVCDIARFPDDEYRVVVPGTEAVAIHVIDGLASTDSPATVDSMTDQTIDPGSQNGGVIGAAVLRSSTQSYVVASSAADGASPTTMTYSVPGANAARHIVFDAPEASDGTSAVTASVSSGNCVVSITAGSGGGLTGHPLMFQMGAASGSCQITDSATSPPAASIPGSPIGTSPTNPKNPASPSGSSSHGCGCTLVGAAPTSKLFVILGLGALVPLAGRRRARRGARLLR